MTVTNPAKPSLAEAQKAAKILFAPGQVVELRALGGRYTVSGYYDDHDKLAVDTVRLAENPQFHGVYWTLQVPNPALLARSPNQFRDRVRETTSDADVEAFRWVLIDLDPDRPAKISATDDEKKAAYEVAASIIKYCREELRHDPVFADSGNGYHVLVRVDLPASDAKLIERVLAALDVRFSTSSVKVDRKVFNPSRISKAYGTVARKGESVADRPHRAASIISAPPVITPLDRAALEKIIAANPSASERKKKDGTEIDPTSAPRAHRTMTLARLARLRAGSRDKLLHADQGEGNDLLNQAAFLDGMAAEALGLTFEQVEAELLHIVCEKWPHPHPRSDAKATIKSGWKKGLKQPITIGFGEKVFGDDRQALLAECAQKYCRDHAPEGPEDVDIRDEGMLFCDLISVNTRRCVPPLRWSELRKLSIQLFEQFTDRKVVVYPGMFEDANQNETDTGYGKHFIRDHGYFVRYNKETSEWLVYSKGVWRVAHDDVEVGRYFKEQFIARENEAALNLHSLHREVQEIKAKILADKNCALSMLEESTLELYNQAVEDVKAAQHGQESRNINSALEQARTEVGIDCTNDDLDADPLLFNCLNAAIDLRSSESIGKRIHRLCTKQSKVIAGDEGCPRFEQILARSLPDEPTREYLQDFFGLCLSGLMVPDILIFLGDGANGKSLIRNIISGVLGDYHAKASMSTFLVSKNVNPGGARTDLAGFRGKRLITASEANRKVMLDMELLKDWTGNEDINARDLWQKGKHAQFQPEGKILLLMNHPPRVIDQSEGTWRRLKYARFDVIIPPEERNDKLAQEVLETEGSGVLNWMLTGWERVRARLDAGAPGLITPEKISRDTSEYKEKESVISRFFEEELEAREGYKTRSADIYNCYASWCKRNNEFQESSTELTLSLQRYCSDRGIKLESRIKVSGARGFSGLKLKEPFGSYSGLQDQ